jgi:membrane protease YdiL (CAAX protease family)
MEHNYPRLRQTLCLALPALLAAQFLVWPLVGLVDPHAGIVATELTIIGFMALYIRRHRLPGEDLLLLNATPLLTLLIALPTAASASLVIAEFDLYVSGIFATFDLSPPLSFQRNLIELQVAQTPLELIKIMIAVALVPAVCEELFFRGFVFTGSYVHYGPRIALTFSALLFATAHFNSWQLPALFLFGLFLAVLTYSTHSIYPAMLAHLVNNTLSVVGINLRTYFGNETLASTAHLPLPVLIIAALTLAGGLFLITHCPQIMPLPPHKHPLRALKAPFT